MKSDLRLTMDYKLSAIAFFNPAKDTEIIEKKELWLKHLMPLKSQ